MITRLVLLLLGAVVACMPSRRPTSSEIPPPPGVIDIPAVSPPSRDAEAPRARVKDAVEFCGSVYPPYVRQLGCHDRTVTDIEQLVHLRDLEVVILDYTGVRDIKPLARLKWLSTLAIKGTRVTDLSPLIGLPCLEQVDISFTAISDLSPLFTLTQLKELLVTKVDLASQVAQLRRVAPSLTVIWNWKRTHGYLHAPDSRRHRIPGRDC